MLDFLFNFSRNFGADWSAKIRSLSSAAFLLCSCVISLVKPGRIITFSQSRSVMGLRFKRNCVLHRWENETLNNSNNIIIKKTLLFIPSSE